jgi:undecaprenyl-diphosphatase
MIWDFLIEWDHRIFFLVNGAHASWLDHVMWRLSDRNTWIPVYALILFSMYRGLSLRSFFWALFFLVVMLLFTDTLVSYAIKPAVMRLRPSHVPAWESLVHLVQTPEGEWYRGGSYGFFSSHASNHAGLVTFLLMILRPVRTALAWALVVWVLVIGYSRIYLGVHYPSDIMVGLLWGALVGLGLGRVFQVWVLRQIKIV